VGAGRAPDPAGEAWRQQAHSGGAGGGGRGDDILSTGCQWSALPKDLPPKSTVHDYLRRWDEDGTLERIHHALYVLCREQALREASPTAAIIDSQSVKSAEKGGAASTRRATMQARRSRVRSAMCWSTLRAC
jgi:hypothetical protein